MSNRLEIAWTEPALETLEEALAYIAQRDPDAAGRLQERVLRGLALGVPDEDAGVGQSIEIFEIRPLWRHPGKKIESSVAKATYVKSRELWKVYWKRADLRWHRYEPAGEMGSLEDVLALVGEDAYGAFWGWGSVRRGSRQAH